MKHKEFGQYVLSCRRSSENKYRVWDYFVTPEQAENAGAELLENGWVTGYKVLFNRKVLIKKEK